MPPLMMAARRILLLLALAVIVDPAAESFLLQPQPLTTSYASPRRKQRCTLCTKLSPIIITTTLHHAMAPSEQDRLLLTEPAQTAFIVAEMKSFLTDALERNDGPSGHLTRWEISKKDMLAAKLIDEDGNVIDEEYREAKRLMAIDTRDDNPITTTNTSGNIKVGGKLAIDILCNTTRTTFKDGFINQPGLLSALGSAICYFRDAFRTGPNLAACERVGLSDYVVAHHITDMFHHRNFRGAYTKTLMPFGTGEIAARIAVGLSMEEDADNGDNALNLIEKDEHDNEDDDECILWSPTTPDVCIHWKSDDDAWRKRRFERIQMEGTKDPRRGGSGTTR
jgi:hypothetical protein